MIAAKAALRRKKAHERSLEQTTAQIAQVEQQIYSIEAANINQETLNAMKNAGSAMKQIHGGLTIDKVDATMYVPFSSFLPLTGPIALLAIRSLTTVRTGDWYSFPYRDELREQHALSEEIASAITNAHIGEPIDEADLEEELEGMEQEAMDERMLKTGTLPVAGEVDRLPAVGNGKLTARPAEEEDEEEELRKLQAEMAMWVNGVCRSR
jgi:charged multivesicular body protein 4